MLSSRPHAGAQFMNKGVKFKSAAYLEKKGCRAIYLQVSQQTRLRSLFLKYNTKQISEMLTEASKSFQSSGEVWETRPSWWEINNDDLSGKYDITLLSGVLRYGFGGFDEMI